VNDSGALSHLTLEWGDRTPDDWEPWLDGAVGASFSTRTAWLDTLSVFDPGFQLRILIARRDGRLVGAVPITLSRRFGRIWVRSLPFGTYGGPLFSADDPDPAGIRITLAEGFSRWLAEEPIAGGELVHAPIGHDTEPYPEWDAISSRITPGYTHVIDLAAGSEAILGGLKRETRKGLRRSEKLGLVVEEEPQALPEVHRLYLEQAGEWGLRRPYPLPFLRALLDHPSGFARLHVARAEGRVQAGVMALTGAGETFLWWSGSAPESRRTLAYPYLLLRILVWAEKNGQQRLNIGSSSGQDRIERFKESIGGSAEPIWIYHVKPQRVDLLTRLYELLRVLRRRV
jgi:hypothetical protein